jgi:hypothetical protein
MQPTIGRWPRNTIALPVCAAESREQHFRLEKKFQALADSHERLHGAPAPQHASDP